jgi:hypothetical protein
MLPQDASRMLPLCMAVYGSVHGSVRTISCVRGSRVCAAVCGSMWQCAAVRMVVYGSGYGSARGSVRLCGSVWQCGCAAVCGSGAVRQCAAVRQCQ